MHAAELLARLGADREPEQLGEPHSDDPGSFSIQRTQAVVAAAEPQLLRGLAQPHARLDLGHLFPRECARAGRGRSLAASRPNTPAPAPGRRTGEDRDDARLSRRDTLELEIVDVPAAAAFAVHQLVVENAKAEIDLGHHPCPMFERMSSGIAATAITSTTTR